MKEKIVVYKPIDNTSGQKEYIPAYQRYETLYYNDAATPAGTTTTIYTVPTGWYARIINVALHYVEANDLASLKVDGTQIYVNTGVAITETRTLNFDIPIVFKTNMQITVIGGVARRWTLTAVFLLTDKRTEPLIF